MNWYDLVFGANENTLVCWSANWCVSCEGALAPNLVSLKPAVVHLYHSWFVDLVENLAGLVRTLLLG